MKIKSGFVIRKVADTYVVVAIGAEAKKHNVMITLNETGCLLWEKLSEGADEKALTDAILEVYDIDEATASRDAAAFLEKVRAQGLLEE